MTSPSPETSAAAAAGAPNRRTSLLVLLIGVLVLFIDGYDLFVLGTVGPSLITDPEWHIAPTTIGTLGSLTALGMPIGAIATARMGDARGRRLPITLCLAWISLCMLLSGLAPGIGVFGLSRFLTGIGIGALSPLVTALIVDWAPPRRRTLFVGVALSGIALGGVVVACIGRAVLPGVHFQTLFLVGLLPLLLVPVCWKAIPSHRPAYAAAPDTATPASAATATAGEAESGWAALFAPGRRLAVVLFCLVAFLGLVLVYGASTWLPTLMIKAGYDLSSALEFTIAFNGGAIVGTLAVALLADRGHLKTATLGLFTAAAVAMLVLTRHHDHNLILAMSALAGMGTLGTQNLVNAWVGRYFGPELRGTALGFVIGLGRLGSILGPSYLTYVTTVSVAPSAGFYAFVAPALLGALAVAFIPTRRGDAAREDRASARPVSAEA
ncbi:MFS transporter [Kitasatospora sp. NBC_01539]|uniref:MFS transporter n=1 Tax=Kitasatospora sp. NBC_01539 TaxID=2903577 RepID=UPI0038603288